MAAKSTAAELVYVITGSTNGIGLEVASGIAKHLAQVAKGSGHLVLPVRDTQKAAGVVQRLEKASSLPADHFHVFQVDLSSQRSVHAAGAAIAAKFPRIHCLVNNAGTGGPHNRTLSVDGIEMTFATNQMAYFTLTNELLPSLKAAGSADNPSRIVNTASNYATAPDLQDLNFERRGYDNNVAYQESKGANRMWSAHLHRALSKEKAHVTVNALHPGVINTPLLRQLGFGGGGSTQSGALTTLHLALSPEVKGVSGKFWDNRRPKADAYGSDVAKSERLFAACQQLANNALAKK